MNFDFCGIGQKGADDQPRAVTERMHPQERVGRLMYQPNQALQFVFGQQHNKGRLADGFG
jgi:hypothetical protein